MKIPAAYLDLLGCPACHSRLRLESHSLSCQACARSYPVRDGIPILLLDEVLTESDRLSLERWNQAWQERALPDSDVEKDPAYADALNHIRDHAPTGAWQNFLEAGCGDGRKGLVIARQKKIPVVGVDTCWEACKLAAQLFEREGQRGLFVVGDLRHLPLHNSVMRYTYAGGSLEHFPDTLNAIAEAYRVTCPGGKLTATVPFISLSTLLYAQLWGNIPDLPIVRPLAEWLHLRLLGGGHMRFGYEKSFTRAHLARLFHQAGFKEIRIDEFITHMEFALLPAWLKGLAAKIVRWKCFWPVVYVDGEK